MRLLALVDGEHYPGVVADALSELSSGGDEVLAAVIVGGKEKLPGSGAPDYGGVRVLSGDDAAELVDQVLEELRPDEVVDLSDEPVLDYRRRHLMVSIALAKGVPYRGADFRFWPPARPHLCATPSLAVIASGKRTGKTAVAGAAARALASAGRTPVIVAMGRGGPREPEVLRGDEASLEPTDLLAMADAGRHAASDYIEDALLGRVATVGCRRCGGGLAGAVVVSNVPAGVDKANDLQADFIVLEGSGSAVPPVHADATGLVLPASLPSEYLTGYLTPYRLLLADLVVITMSDGPEGSPSDASHIASYVRRSFRPRDSVTGSRRDLRVVRTVFRPRPVREVDGARVFVATTAPESARRSIVRDLEEEYGCKVVGMTHALSDRPHLEHDLDGLGDKADVLLCEVKAAGVDVATRRALDAGVDVVYMDNVPEGIEGDDLTEAIEWAARLAEERFEGTGR